MSKLTDEQRARKRSLVDRLRGIYRIPITDGLGPVGAGDEPDNPSEYVRSDFKTPPIQHEAAAEIEDLRAAVRPDPSLIAALEMLVNARALQRPPTDAEWRTAIGALAQAKGQTERKEKESHGG